LKPARALAKNFGLVGADFLPQLAQSRLPRGFAGIDPALRHLPRRDHRYVDAASDKGLPAPVQQHNADSRTVRKRLDAGLGHAIA
jgi:hypothetical protein